MEKPFFFSCEGFKLFSMLHVPGKLPVKKTGFVFCAPFAEEKLWSQRVFVNFARALAKNGYYSLRFDYRGHGDSDGVFEDATIETRLSDIKNSVDFLKKQTGVENVCVLGLRIGATLAALFSKTDKIDFLILWEPIIDGQKYIQQCLRSNLATQMSLYRKIRKTREQLIEQLKIGGYVNIDGYLISREFYDQIIDINLNKQAGHMKQPVLVCKINKTASAKMSPELEEFQNICLNTHPLSSYRNICELAFWGELKVYFQNADNLFEETLRWIDSAVN